MGKNNYIGIVFLMISISYAIKLGSKGLSLAMTEEEIAANELNQQHKNMLQT